MKLNNFFHDKLTRQAPTDPAPGGDPAPVVTPDPAPAADLSFIPADFHTDGKPDTAKFTAHYQDLVARDAQIAERMGQVPEAYDFAIPADLKFEGLDLPEGFAVKLATDDPAIAPLYNELGSFLKEIGAPAAAASKVSELLARYEATKYSQAYVANKAEMQALGTPAQQSARMAAIDRAISAKLPAAQAEALKAATTTSAGVQALEALLRPGGYTAPNAQPNTPETSGMTARQKLDYANSQTKT